MAYKIKNKPAKEKKYEFTFLGEGEETKEGKPYWTNQRIKLDLKPAKVTKIHYLRDRFGFKNVEFKAKNDKEAREVIHLFPHATFQGHYGRAIANKNALNNEARGWN